MKIEFFKLVSLFFFNSEKFVLIESEKIKKTLNIHRV